MQPDVANIHQDVTKEMLGSLKAILYLKVVWRSAWTEHGAQCAALDGVMLMHKSCADSWDYLLQVCIHY